MNVRQRVLEYLELLSQPSRQLDYEAYRTGKKLEWDYKTMRAANAPESAPFIKRPEYRKGWDDILKT